MRFLSLRGSFARLRLPSDTSISHEAAFFLTAEEVPQSSLTRILLPLSALAMTFLQSFSLLQNCKSYNIRMKALQLGRSNERLGNAVPDVT